MAENHPGVSIIICCHNSATRLPPTLAHAAAQDDSVPWEVLIVDNASTDGSAAAALRHWPADARDRLRVTSEPRLGLTHARLRGLAEARFEFVSFIDDDNWLAPDWTRVAAEVMARHPEVGACGGLNEPVFETVPPRWFGQYRTSYSVGPQADQGGDITETRGFLWGAGLTVRASALRSLLARGFRPLLADRRGRALTYGGDRELCAALHAAGWRLWYEPTLRLRHFLPAQRLRWSYLRRAHRGLGACSLALDAYRSFLRPGPSRGLGRIRETWPGEALVSLLLTARDGIRMWAARDGRAEGAHQALQFETHLGRLVEVLRRRRVYTASFARIRGAAWRDPGRAMTGRRPVSVDG